MAKFSDQEIIRIRANLEGWSPREWAAVFQTNTETIRRIIRHETYAKVTDNPNLPRSMPTIDPMKASALRVLYGAGIDPETIRKPANPLTEEPSQADLEASQARLTSESGQTADQALEEFMRLRGGTDRKGTGE